MLFLRLIWESVSFAIGSLVANKLRTLLSLLGVVIGIFVIILILASVDSLKKDVNESISSLGDDVVYVHKWPWEGGFDYPWWKYLLRPQAEYDEVAELIKRSQLAESVSYRVVVNRTIKYQNNSVQNVEINGIAENYHLTTNIDIDDGRFFTDNEIRSGKNIAILGHTISSGLFEDDNSIGKSIKIQGKKFEVVGSLEKEGESLIGTGADSKVYIPYPAIRTLADLNNWRVHKELVVKARPGISNSQLKDELTGIMRSIRKLKPGEEDNFSLNEASILAKEMGGITSILNIVGWVIGLLAILVGGFGISNIMFVSVKERTNLIGIQKALGARKSFILLQFLVEALVLSLIGGLLGLLLVFFTSLLVQSISTFNLALSIQNVVIGVFISAVVGLFSGLMPAYSASQLDPVEAMRAK
ncbi:MAG: ABC transporter permease [Candidatus Competibacteraceae bacterium]|nr:ABC transporter permease [Candidatus Competibacteraceae bacterium]